MTRYDIIARIGSQFHIGNTESGEFSYVQALKSVGKDIKDYQKATTGEKHKMTNMLRSGSHKFQGRSKEF